MRIGEALVDERDSGKRTCDDMSAREQQILEAYDTGKCGKLYE